MSNSKQVVPIEFKPICRCCSIHRRESENLTILGIRECKSNSIFIQEDPRIRESALTFCEQHMEEEDDPVVQEVDVFLSKRLADSLYLFQYPARPSNRHLDGTNHLGARVKLKQSKVGCGNMTSQTGKLKTGFEPAKVQILVRGVLNIYLPACSA